MVELTRRPRVLMRCFGATALANLVAMLIVGCLMLPDATSSADEPEAIGVPPRVSTDEAIGIAAEWGRWLGVEEADLVLHRPQASLNAFHLSYVITTRDGAYEFNVDAYHGYVIGWRNKQLRGQELSPEQYELRDSLAMEFISEHLNFPDISRVRQVGPARYPQWVQFLSDDVALHTTQAYVGVDIETRQIRMMRYSFEPIRITPTPSLTPAECAEIARREVDLLGRWQSVRESSNDSDPRNWREQYYIVWGDGAGVQRMERPFTFYVVPRRLFPFGDAGDVEQSLRICLDALTGKVWYAFGPPEVEGAFLNRQTGLVINGKPFDFPIYPIERVRGMYYIYIGYFESRIWDGSLDNATEDAARLTYAGRTWELRANEVPTVDGEPSQVRARPRTIDGYLYLPVSLVEPITGWTVRANPREQEVYLESPEYRSRVEEGRNG